MDNYAYRFSVFTATYNRCGKLKDLYECLVRQDFLGSFEWVLVSDGSTDETDGVVAGFLSEEKVDINYIKIPHSGKHQAWRVATKEFKGRYVITADDDDPISSNMLSVFDKHWHALESSAEYEKFWEVKSRAQYENGSLVGYPLPSPYYDSDYIEVNFIQGKGAEMDGCRKVEILQNEASVPDSFLFEEKCTNFPEGVRWTRAARKYKTRFVPDITRTYIVGHESLCTSTSNVRSRERNYNSLVSSLYTLNEASDILIRFQIRKYLKLVLQLAYSAVRLNENVISHISRCRDRMLYALMYLPAFLIFSFRKY